MLAERHSIAIPFTSTPITGVGGPQDLQRDLDDAHGPVVHADPPEGLGRDESGSLPQSFRGGAPGRRSGQAIGISWPAEKTAQAVQNRDRLASRADPRERTVAGRSVPGRWLGRPDPGGSGHTACRKLTRPWLAARSTASSCRREPLALNGSPAHSGSHPPSERAETAVRPPAASPPTRGATMLATGTSQPPTRAASIEAAATPAPDLRDRRPWGSRDFDGALSSPLPARAWTICVPSTKRSSVWFGSSLTASGDDLRIPVRGPYLRPRRP